MADPLKPDLFPVDVLQDIATPQTIAPAAPDDAEAKRREVFGPLYGAITVPSSAGGDLQQQLQAEGALALLPAALLGPLAKPLVDGAYKIVDYLPEAIRRPFEKDLGLLIDNAVSYLADATFPLVGQTLDQYGGALPASRQLDIQGFSQRTDSCGPTAAATILKAEGVPVPLASVDTQVSGFNGTSGQLAEELRRRGLTVVGGSGDLDKLRTLVAAGMPVLVQVGWEGGGGHFAVVSGYDDRTQTLTIENWNAAGATEQVGYRDFQQVWKNVDNLMTAALPRRDPRFDQLAQDADWRRPTPIYEGLTLSDFWVTPDGKVYVEGAYRYVGKTTDVTVRVGFDSSEAGLARQLGGSVAVRQLVAPGWYVGLRVDKMSLRGQDEDWHHFATAPLSIYGSVEGPKGFKIEAGAERGGFQAQLVAQLCGAIGMQASVSVGADGAWSVTASIAGTF